MFENDVRRIRYTDKYDPYIFSLNNARRDEYFKECLLRRACTAFADLIFYDGYFDIVEGSDDELIVDLYVVTNKSKRHTFLQQIEDAKREERERIAVIAKQEAEEYRKENSRVDATFALKEFAKQILVMKDEKYSMAVWEVK